MPNAATRRYLSKHIRHYCVSWRDEARPLLPCHAKISTPQRTASPRPSRAVGREPDAILDWRSTRLRYRRRAPLDSLAPGRCSRRAEHYTRRDEDEDASATSALPWCDTALRESQHSATSPSSMRQCALSCRACAICHASNLPARLPSRQPVLVQLIYFLLSAPIKPDGASALQQ